MCTIGFHTQTNPCNAPTCRAACCGTECGTGPVLSEFTCECVGRANTQDGRVRAVLPVELQGRHAKSGPLSTHLKIHATIMYRIPGLDFRAQPMPSQGQHPLRQRQISILAALTVPSGSTHFQHVQFSPSLILVVPE